MGADEIATGWGRSLASWLAVALMLAMLVPAALGQEPARAADAGAADAPPVRRALVVGMSGYDDPRMRVPGDRTRADAEGVADTLRGVAGYVAPTLMPADADTVTFMKVFSEFARSVDAGDQVLLFYSGHGVEFRGEAYLLLREAHADLASDRDDAVTKAALDRSAIKVRDLVERLQQSGASNIIVVLNACRNATDAPLGGQLGTGDAVEEGFDLPPPGRIAGLKARDSTGVGTLFATSGDTFAEVCLGDCDGDPSPYTVFGRRFIEMLAQPNLRVADLVYEVGAAVQDDVATHFPNREQRVDWHDQTNFRLKGRIFLGPVEAGAPDVVEAATAKEPVTEPAATPAPAVSVPSAASILDDPAALACAELAAPPGWNPEISGTLLHRVDATRAIAACEEALRARPDAPEVQFLLGLAYQSGSDVEQSSRHFQQAADQGYVAAQAALGRLLMFRGTDQATEQRAIRNLTLAMEQGDAAATFDLAHLYLAGWGVDRNSDESKRLLYLAADRGSVDAQYTLGRMYENGSSVTQSDTDAARYYRLAADQGYPSAQYSLGNLYFEGRGVDQSDGEAARYYRLAADQGFMPARYNLGNMYSTGRGVARDDAEAVRLYRLAADQGYMLAQYNLGNMYFNGTGVAQSDAEAVRYYRLAADRGYADAQYNLGNMLASGRGIGRDVAEARRYYQLAADQGQEDAAAALERLGR